MGKKNKTKGLKPETYMYLGLTSSISKFCFSYMYLISVYKYLACIVDIYLHTMSYFSERGARECPELKLKWPRIKIKHL